MDWRSKPSTGTSVELVSTGEMAVWAGVGIGFGAKKLCMKTIWDLLLSWNHVSQFLGWIFATHDFFAFFHSSSLSILPSEHSTSGILCNWIGHCNPSNGLTQLQPIPSLSSFSIFWHKQWAPKATDLPLTSSANYFPAHHPPTLPNSVSLSFHSSSDSS